jgi:hypothetical protein
MRCKSSFYHGDRGSIGSVQEHCHLEVPALALRWTLVTGARVRLHAVSTLKRYSKALEYEYRVKTATLGTLKRYYIISLTLYLEWYCAYSILYNDGPH